MAEQLELTQEDEDINKLLDEVFSSVPPPAPIPFRDVAQPESTEEDEEDVVLKAPDRIEDMIPVFDYGNIKPEHQALVRDILQRIDNNKQPEDIKNDLSVLFKLQGENEFDLEKSTFIKYAKRVNLGPAKQGHITVKEGKDVPINYPIISVCDDIRKLDKLVEEIMKDVMLKAREIQNNGSK